MVYGQAIVAVVQLLQWVQRPRTPVMFRVGGVVPPRHLASMGPASENAGYVFQNNHVPAVGDVLQWVQRPRTPVMAAAAPAVVSNRKLQWVQRPRTPVMQ